MKRMLAILLVLLIAAELMACGGSPKQANNSQPVNNISTNTENKNHSTNAEAEQPGQSRSAESLFEGSWTVSELAGDDYTSKISFSGNTATVVHYGETLSAPYSITKEGGYTCLFLDYKADPVLFVLIDEGMLGVATEATDESSVCTLAVGGRTFDVEFYNELIWMRKDSAEYNTALPAGLQSYGEVGEYCYYPNHGIVHVWLDGEVIEFFYLDSKNTYTYIECISIPSADGLYSDSIYTDKNFVITDWR